MNGTLVSKLWNLSSLREQRALRIAKQTGKNHMFKSLLPLLMIMTPVAKADDEKNILDRGIELGGEQLNKLTNSDTYKKSQEITEGAVSSGKSLYQKIVGVKPTAVNRENSTISIFYMPINYGLLLPIKSGFSGSWILSRTTTIEFEYLSASYGLGYLGVDLLDLSEKLISASARWYIGNSFYFKMGYGQRHFNFSIGDQLINDLSGEDLLNTSLKVENDFLALGLGNLWQFDNGFTWGFDWFELIVPIGSGTVDNSILSEINNDNDRKNAKDVISYMEHGLSFNALKFHLGYTF